MSGTAPVVAQLTGARCAELVAGLGVGLLLVHENGAVHATSGAAAELLGCEPGGARPPGWQLRDDHGVPLPDLQVLAAQARAANTPATIAVMVTARHAPPRRLWLELYPATLRGERLVLVTLRRVDTDAWRGRGLLDPLTGLANRILMFDRIDQALRRSRVRGSAVTLVLADVRGLGALPVEDGDRLLRTVAERLTSGLGEDHTVARYGGGTFAIVGETVGERRRGGGGSLAELVTRLVEWPVRVGSATSHGTHTVHDLVCRAHRRLA